VASKPPRQHIEEGDLTEPMERKAQSTRKPPEPSDSHAEIEDWMRRLMPDLQPLVAKVDSMLREAHPDLQFAVKWKKAYYGLPGQGWLLEMVAYDVSVNVVFFAGADFEPSPPHGDSGRTRYVKLKTLDDVEHPDLRKWIAQAAHHAGWT
jgi:hypothetical protein